MELKEFIEETLKQIVEGVKAAQTSLQGTGAIIIPADMHPAQTDRRINGPDNKQYYVDAINFEVALTTKDGASTGKGLSVVFAAIGGQYKKLDSTDNELLNRVSFTIPVLYPISGEQRKLEFKNGAYAWA